LAEIVKSLFEIQLVQLLNNNFILVVTDKSSLIKASSNSQFCVERKKRNTPERMIAHTVTQCYNWLAQK